MNINKIWFEKYRPKTLDDLIINSDTRDILLKYKENKDIPHLLFTTSAGTGKTTLAKIIVNDILECDYLYINASDENGIDVIRTKVTNFAQTKSSTGGIKVIILDEACGISPEAQKALRNVMEEYSEYCRFILTANFNHKIIEPIKSRCTKLDFESDVKDITKRLVHILKTESIKFNKEDISKLFTLVSDNYPDIRTCINLLQKYSLTGEFIIKESEIDDKLINDIWDKLNNDFISLREFIINNETKFNADYHQLMKSLLNYIYKLDVTPNKKRDLIIHLGEYMFRSSTVVDQEINCYLALLQLSKIV